MTQDTLTANRRSDAGGTGTYDVYMEIDCDCEELLQACDIEYDQCKDDGIQNEVAFHLDREDFLEDIGTAPLHELNEQNIAQVLLNPELGEYTTKLTVYTPSGDVIMFK